MHIFEGDRSEHEVSHLRKGAVPRVVPVSYHWCDEQASQGHYSLVCIIFLPSPGGIPELCMHM